MIDLGTGTGALPVLIGAATVDSELVAFEKQESLFSRATRNCILNGLGDRCRIVCADISDPDFTVEQGDLVISNPPFYPENLKSRVPPQNEVHLHSPTKK